MEKYNDDRFMQVSNACARQEKTDDIESIPSYNIGFADGVEWCEKHPNWREVKRDNVGFATDESLDEMFASIPIIVVWRDKWGVVGTDLIDKEKDLCDWRGDIERKPMYKYWLKANIPLSLYSSL